ncbi:uncharacterized protein LOC136090791 [Hydra vulgaris]|uniref:Uncharacterized protein LOC136090791 n=1 Tax=Hydra vulgaris TaxID=6087 RepID=A0ABM4DH62_HYDVU
MKQYIKNRYIKNCGCYGENINEGTICYHELLLTKEEEKDLQELMEMEELTEEGYEKYLEQLVQEMEEESDDIEELKLQMLEEEMEKEVEEIEKEMHEILDEMDWEQYVIDVINKMDNLPELYL